MTRQNSMAETSRSAAVWTIWQTLFVLSLLVLAFVLLVQPLGDPDVFIHLRDGRYWVENHWRVGLDPFSYTASDKPFETAEWLFRITLYGLWKLGGYDLLIVVKSLAMTLALFWLGKSVYRSWPNLAAVTLLMLAGALAPDTRIFPERPYVVTYVLVPLILLWLEQYRQAAAALEPGLRRRLWLIPPLVAIWSNLHPGFMVIFGFLGAYAAHDLLTAWRENDALAWRRVRSLFWISLAAVAAGACNPMGFSLYTFSVDIMRSNAFMSYITEWAPPQLGREPVFFGLLAVIWLAQAANWRKVRVCELLPLLAFSYLAVKSYRNMPLLIIAGLPMTARNLKELWQSAWPKLRLPLAWRQYALQAGVALAVGLAVTAARTGFAFQFGLLPDFYPTGGMAWMELHPVSGRLFTHDIWGGYTGWITHGRVKIFMDGRLPTYGEKIYADYRRIVWGDPAGCLPLLDRYQIQAVLVSPKNDIKLYQELWHSGAWALIYWDDGCLLYVRKDGPNRELAAAYAYQAVDPKRSPFFNPADPAQAMTECRRAVTAAPRSYLPLFLLGELQMQEGKFIEAAGNLSAVLRLVPTHPGAHYSLGVIAQSQQRPEEAERHFRESLRWERPGEMYAKTCFLLAQTLLRDRRNLAEARAWARKALEILPAWQPAQQLNRQLDDPLP